MGSRYTFFDYINNGDNLIHRWLYSVGGGEKDNKKIRQAYLARFVHLEATLPSNWRRPYAAFLTEGDCAGLYEIRVKVRDTQYRLLGFHGPGPERGIGTLVFGAREIGDRFDPRDACRRAQVIKRRVESNPIMHRSVHDFS